MFIIYFSLIFLSFIFFPVFKDQIRKRLWIFLIISLLGFYFFIKPIIFTPPLIYISGNKIIKKPVCFPSLFQCRNVEKEKIMMEIDKSSMIVKDGNVISYKIINIDPLFDPSKNPNMIEKLLKSMGINIVSKSNFKYNNDKTIEITTLDCGIVSNLTELPCDRTTKKKEAYYNVSLPNINGKPCADLAYNLPEDKKNGYTNWKFDFNNNRIKGERNCENEPCSIIGDIIENNCVNNVKYGYYNIAEPLGTGYSCENLINNLTFEQKRGYTEWNYDNINKAIISIKNCISDKPCEIIGDINKDIDCDINTLKKYATYNVSSNTGEGLPCTYVAESLSLEQKEDYINWKYDENKNAIIGEKDCCKDGNIYYNGFCSSNLVCPNYTYRDVFDRKCVNNCKEDEKKDLVDKRCLRKCLNPRPFDNNGICSDNCGEKHEYKFKCIEDCSITSDKRYLNTENNQCVSVCPLGKVIDGLTCKNNCNPKYKNDTVCLDSCPSDKLIDEVNNECVSTCPPERPFNIAGVCKAECPSPLYGNIITKTCVDSCPTNLFIDGNKCVTDCPINKKWKNGKICSENCGNNYHNYLNSTCVTSCPNSTKVKEKTKSCVINCKDQPELEELIYSPSDNKCVDTCPATTPTITNGNCTITCPQYQYINNEGKCINDSNCRFPNVLHNGECLTECPDGMLINRVGYRSFCSALCPYPWYFRSGNFCYKNIMFD